MKQNILIKGLDFSLEEISKSRHNQTLLSFDLETSLRCNLKCIYCYSQAGKKVKNELKFPEMCSVIEQAKEMGAQKVVIIGGGEPLLHPNYWKLLEKIRKSGLSSITFTNGTLINRDVAQKLFDYKEDLAVKFNSFSEDVQDFLAGGIIGTGTKIRAAIDNLLELGFSSGKNYPKLALETIICKQNIKEIEKIYRFCRENNITPYVELLTIQGSAKNHRDVLNVNLDEAFELFKSLKHYDQSKWGISWPLTPPIVGQNCKRMYYSAYITSTGEVQPCPGVDISGGNIREKKLKEIISKSSIFNSVRNIDKNVKGVCRQCDYLKKTGCYGCRGTALHHSNDFLASDPTCWWADEHKR